jgi:hypothetical protein
MELPALRRFLPLLLVMVPACHGIDVQSSHDPDVDFSKVKTFAFAAAPPQATTVVGDTSLIGMIGAQLEAKGLKRAEQDPDVLVAVHRSLEGSVNTHAWGYEVQGGRIGYYTLQEGTLVVDLVDPKRKTSIWRGTATGAFRADMDQESRRAMLADLLRDMFAEFPPKR